MESELVGPSSAEPILATCPAAEKPFAFLVKKFSSPPPLAGGLVPAHAADCGTFNF